MKLLIKRPKQRKGVLRRRSMLLFKHTFQEIKKLKTNELYTQLKNLEMGKPREKMRKIQGQKSTKYRKQKRT